LRTELVKVNTAQQEKQLSKLNAAKDELYKVQLHLEEVQEFAELLESFEAEAWFGGLQRSIHESVEHQKKKNDKCQQNTLVLLESSIAALKQSVDDYDPPDLPNGAAKKSASDRSLGRSAMIESPREEQKEEEEGKQKESATRCPSQAGLLEGVIHKKSTSTWSRVSDMLLDVKERLDKLNSLNRLDYQIIKWEEAAAIKQESIFDESIARLILSVTEQLNKEEGVGEWGVPRPIELDVGFLGWLELEYFDSSKTPWMGGAP
jgi:hypothetical protein